MDQISLCISRNKAGTLPKNVPKILSKIFWGFAWEGCNFFRDNFRGNFRDTFRVHLTLLLRCVMVCAVYLGQSCSALGHVCALCFAILRLDLLCLRPSPFLFVCATPLL